ncbi:acetyltransferase [Acetobacterium carbinolicum]|uniref:acetyltransferase n=1 Tax=Acetobacterium carbinolicum TaxID=52690 RepID=UPI0039BF93C7
MKNDRILLIGGGGHCKSVLDSLLNLSHYDEIRIIDKKENVGNKILSIDIIGTDDDLVRLFKEGYKNAFVSVGSIGNTSHRRKIFELVEIIGFNTPNIIDSSAIVSENAIVNKGIFIGRNAIINADATINTGAIINTGSIIEHNCFIDKFAHISPGAVLCGDVTVGENTHIGAASVLKQQVTVGRDTVIGMGSVVICDIGNNSVAYGNPCSVVCDKIDEAD